MHISGKLWDTCLVFKLTTFFELVHYPISKYNIHIIKKPFNVFCWGKSKYTLGYSWGVLFSLVLIHYHLIIVKPSKINLNIFWIHHSNIVHFLTYNTVLDFLFYFFKTHPLKKKTCNLSKFSGYGQETDFLFK